MFWFDKHCPDAIFGDKRIESHILCDGRALRIEPNVLMDFTALPFDSGAFRVVVFDPPHLVQVGEKSWLAKKYGRISDNWRDDIRQGFSECFRVLEDSGVLVFKWNESQIKVKDLLSLTDRTPLFGNTSGRKAGTHWYVFLK